MYPAIHPTTVAGTRVYGCNQLLALQFAAFGRVQAQRGGQQGTGLVARAGVRQTPFGQEKGRQEPQQADSSQPPSDPVVGIVGKRHGRSKERVAGQWMVDNGAMPATPKTTPHRAKKIRGVSFH